MIQWPWSVRTPLVSLMRSDAEALAEIHSSAFARMWTADEFAALLAERTAFAIGIRRDWLARRRLVGFVLVRVVLDEAEILTIAVRKDCRGRGYGRMLMTEALRRLSRAGAVACFLEVDGDNAPAVGLYRSLGFEIVGRRKDYYQAGSPGGGTALVMRVQLR